MKYLIATALSVTLVLGSVSPIVAQNASANANASKENGNRNGNGNGNQNRENGNNGQPENPGRSNDLNYGRIISSLRNGTAESYADAFATAETYNLVMLSSLPGRAAENANALSLALESAGQSVESLQASIDANTALADAIEASGYDVDQIIGWTATVDGDIILIINDLT
jgi:hypothetical protein